MRFFTKNRSSKKRIIEEWVYERVADELEMGEIRKGLWTKARGMSDGDANKCESIYIQLRAESIVDEAKIIHEADETQIKELKIKLKEMEKKATAQLSNSEPNSLRNKNPETHDNLELPDDMPSYLKPRNATSKGIPKNENKYEQLQAMNLHDEQKEGDLAEKQSKSRFLGRILPPR
ncbi:hypothetical protein [Vibrio superstes]|uniref:Uncharacterized protein n=1 Tax=Vibrio superstes NBRC 103154 TaxID=1219062 RepID=A0A511QL11_9VIBR|nr:hypothetical protein [Vibrio superstes]GEM77867.1 hypothetical protein VSU01S_01120 [Vibrio superstes NBRC 103154]